eukprot:m.208060 g.208060  ORF g.208060 m.208060 type:complete len:391 (+) comp18956_c0_seq1:140-1312(+)
MSAVGVAGATLDAQQNGKVFLGALLGVAQKACEIARCLRSNAAFGSNLVNQKADREKGETVEQDFVSIADIFIQCVVKHDLEMLFPDLRGRVLGEETEDFQSSSSSTTLTICIQPTEEETVDQLRSLLGDHMDASVKEIAAVAHRKPDIVPVSCIPADTKALNINLSQTALWIDPIDGTSSYIKGNSTPRTEGIAEENGTLSTVTFLLGAFDTCTGTPFCGVVAQPFAPSVEQESPHCARYFWGISAVGDLPSDHDVSSHKYWGELSNTDAIGADASFRDSTLTVVHSKSEKREVVQAMQSLGGTMSVGGAGYKLLVVARKLAESFVLTLPTTYPWDTCGPHAIIRAMGGSVVDTTGNHIVYSVQNSEAHEKGIVASLSVELSKSILSLL